MTRSLATVLSVAGLTLLLSGCSTTLPRPVRSAADFRPESMDAVYVLPVVDARADKKLKLNLVGLQKSIAATLKRKRYSAVVLPDPGLVAGLTDEDIREPSRAWIGGIGPAEARWVMVMMVGELSRKITFGSTGNAEVSLAILDKQTGAVVWEDKALGRAGQGGLIGMCMVASMDGEALASAVAQIMHKIPKKPKRP